MNRDDHNRLEQAANRKLLKNVFFEYIWVKRWSILFLVAMIIAGVAISNVSPYLYGKMIDAINDKSLERLIKLILLYCSINVTAVVMSLIERYCGELISFSITNQMKKVLFKRAIGATCEDYDRYTTGELMSRLNGDSESIVSFFIELFTSAGQVMVNLVVSVFYIITISLRLSSAALFYLPMTFLVSFQARRVFKKLAYHQRQLDDKYYSFLSESLSNHEGIKAYQLEKSINNKYAMLISDRLKLTKKNLRTKNTVTMMNRLITMVSSMYVIYMSAVLIRQGVLTLGDMVAFNTYINLMYTSVNTIWNFNISWQSVLVSAKRIREFMDIDEEDIDEGKERNFGIGHPCLSFVDVEFTYPGAKKAVLQDIDFCINACGLYGVIGKNGCGKSTLAKLLVRFYKIENGEYRLFDNNVKEIPLRELRKQITYIPKDDFFLKETVMENIRLAAPEVTEEAIIEACKTVGIHSFIMSLPRQYATVIGEGGANLSSGQRQKLSLARAFLRQSKIIILDETTANLDGGAEQEIINVLRDLKKHSLIILISHKPAPIKACDKVFVIDRGRVLDEGSQQELRERCSLYRELVGEEQTRVK